MSNGNPLVRQEDEHLVPNGLLGAIDTGLAKRESGVIVPANLAGSPEANLKRTPVARDMDGRRRVLYTDSERRNLNRVLTMLITRGLAAVVACIGGQEHGDGGNSCGDIMLAEGKGTDDPGFGCKCTRIHWVKP
jgi:hypothetical protein